MDDILTELMLEIPMLRRVGTETEEREYFLEHVVRGWDEARNVIEVWMPKALNPHRP